MGPARIIILAIAAIAAIFLMLVVGRLMGHKPAPPPPTPVVAPVIKITNVVVASHDLAIGAQLSASDLTTLPWPADSVNPAFITDGQAVATSSHGAATGAQSPLEALHGAIVRTPILANEPVTNAKLVRGGEGGYMAVVLRPGMRAVAAPVNVNTGAGGFILPGDRVDVLQARQIDAPNGGARPWMSRTLLRNIRVVAIDQTAQPPKNGAQSMVGAVVTLEVSPSDAELVTLARAQGELVLTLRSYADVRAPSGRAAAAAVNVGTVRIFRNGQLSETQVTP